MIKYTEKPDAYAVTYGKTYYCNHPLYDVCTLYTINGLGLAIIQQHHDDKYTYWGEIEPWLRNLLYTNSNFYSYFLNHADDPKDGLYPTVTIRQIMHGLGMKPLKKEYWETVFDRPITEH